MPKALICLRLIPYKLRQMKFKKMCKKQFCLNSLVTLCKADSKGKNKTIGNHFQIHRDVSVSNQNKAISLYIFTNHSQRSTSVFESLDSFFEVISDNLP